MQVEVAAEAVEKATEIPGLAGVMATLLVVCFVFMMGIISWMGRIMLRALENNTKALTRNSDQSAALVAEERNTQEKISDLEQSITNTALICARRDRD